MYNTRLIEFQEIGDVNITIFHEFRTSQASSPVILRSKIESDSMKRGRISELNRDDLGTVLKKVVVIGQNKQKIISFRAVLAIF